MVKERKEVNGLNEGVLRLAACQVRGQLIRKKKDSREKILRFS